MGFVNGAIGNITGIKWPGVHRHQPNNEIPAYMKVDFGAMGPYRVEPIIKEFNALRIVAPLLVECFHLSFHGKYVCNANNCSFKKLKKVFIQLTNELKGGKLILMSFCLIK